MLVVFLILIKNIFMKKNFISIAAILIFILLNTNLIAQNNTIKKEK
jgi:hypothetical protein